MLQEYITKFRFVYMFTCRHEISDWCFLCSFVYLSTFAFSSICFCLVLLSFFAFFV